MVINIEEEQDAFSFLKNMGPHVQDYMIVYH
jgi:hypothetical protein